MKSSVKLLLAGLAASLLLSRCNTLKNIQTIDLAPYLGLYSKKELQQIADTTHCDILLSFDLFTSLDGIGYNPQLEMSYHLVFNMAFWNFYDLTGQKLQYFYNRVDTISFQSDEFNAFVSLQKLPQRKKALKEAAQISAISFAEFLVPHWEPVQRMYYKSGNSGLKKTDKFISEEKWLEAAEIWKANISNKNKKIAAKSMFNMALAAEMEGHLDAAIDWAVKSYHVFGEENRLHAENCKEYIRILSTRKRDLKIIERQSVSRYVHSTLLSLPCLAADRLRTLPLPAAHLTSYCLPPGEAAQLSFKLPDWFACGANKKLPPVMMAVFKNPVNPRFFY